VYIVVNQSQQGCCSFPCDYGPAYRR